MMAAAAFILGVSLIFMGVVIIGSSLGWWHIQDDVWGWIIAVLATVSRWVAAKVKRSELDPEKPEDAALNGDKTKGAGAVLLVLIAFSGCAGMSQSTKAGFEAYGSCVGSQALSCAGQASGDDLEQKAVSYAACMASAAVLCAPTATAASNPPGKAGAKEIGLLCLKRSFESCHKGSDVKSCSASAAASCAR